MARHLIALASTATELYDNGANFGKVHGIDADATATFCGLAADFVLKRWETYRPGSAPTCRRCARKWSA